MVRTRSDMTNIIPVTYGYGRVSETDSWGTQRDGGCRSWEVEMSGLPQMVELVQAGLDDVQAVSHLVSRHEIVAEVLVESVGGVEEPAGVAVARR